MLSSDEIDRLAVYNAERWRGLMHTEEYQKQMAVLQERFNQSHSSTAPFSAQVPKKGNYQ